MVKEVSRVWECCLRVVGVGLFCSLLAGAWGSAGATRFDSPPTIGDREVAFTWPADADDAVFTGNIVLEVSAEYPFLHGVGHSVVDLVPFVGRDFLSYAEGEDHLVRWNRDDGAVVGTFSLGSDLGPVDLSLHGTGRYVLGARTDGSVEFWDLDNEATPSRIEQISPFPLRRVEFLPRIQDPTDRRFIAAGEDSLVYFMDGLTSVQFTMRVPGGGTQAIAVSPNTDFLVTGGRDARLRVWNIRSRPNSPQPFFVLHRGTVQDIIVDPLSDRVASVDETGHVIISRLQTGQILGEFDVDATQGPAKLTYSYPQGAVLSVAQANGTLSVHDGYDGQLFRAREVSPDGITAFAISQDGERTVAGDRDGRVRLLRAGRCQPSLADPVCFGGYRIWRNTIPDSSGAQLIREYRFDSDTWTLNDVTHHFMDPDSLVLRVAPPGEEDPEDELRPAGPHNGVPYFYSVTRFDRHFLNGAVFDVNQNTILEGFYRDPGAGVPTPIVPAAGARADLPLLGQILVVPNPYVAGTVQWDAIGGEHIEFRNLPEVASLKILNVAGDLVRKLEHGRDRYGAARSTLAWDLRNSSGRDVSSGVYIYQVETPSGEVVQGYFIVVR